MSHQETKSELVTEKTISEMKFSKENFRKLQELNVVQSEQINTINKCLKDYQEVTRQLKDLILEKESSINYLDSIIKLRDKKVTIEITVNDVKNAE